MSPLYSQESKERRTTHNFVKRQQFHYSFKKNYQENFKNVRRNYMINEMGNLKGSFTNRNANIEFPIHSEKNFSPIKIEINPSSHIIERPTQSVGQKILIQNSDRSNNSFIPQTILEQQIFYMTQGQEQSLNYKSQIKRNNNYQTMIIQTQNYNSNQFQNSNKCQNSYQFQNYQQSQKKTLFEDIVITERSLKYQNEQFLKNQLSSKYYRQNHGIHVKPPSNYNLVSQFKKKNINMHNYYEGQTSQLPQKIRIIEQTTEFQSIFNRKPKNLIQQKPIQLEAKQNLSNLKLIQPKAKQEPIEAEYQDKSRNDESPTQNFNSLIHHDFLRHKTRADRKQKKQERIKPYDYCQPVSQMSNTIFTKKQNSKNQVKVKPSFQPNIENQIKASIPIQANLQSQAKPQIRNLQKKRALFNVQMPIIEQIDIKQKGNLTKPEVQKPKMVPFIRCENIQPLIQTKNISQILQNKFLIKNDLNEKKKQNKQSHSDQYNNFKNKTKLPKENIYLSLGQFQVFNCVVGKGSFASVYEGYDTITQKKVAIKQIKHKDFCSNQTNCLRRIQHRNIIKLYGVFEHQKPRNPRQNFDDTLYVYMVMQWADQNLNQYLKQLKRKNSHQPQQQVKMKVQISQQLIEGMNALYENDILHRDLKLENILVHNGILKIADFGLARTLDNNLQVETVRGGTPYTMAPQIFFHSIQKKAKYTFKCDIYSLCVILHDILYETHPFDSNKYRLQNFQRIDIMSKYQQMSKYNDANCNIRWIEQIINAGLRQVQFRSQWTSIMNIYKNRKPIQIQQKKNNQNTDNYFKRSDQAPNFSRVQRRQDFQSKIFVNKKQNKQQKSNYQQPLNDQKNEKAKDIQQKTPQQKRRVHQQQKQIPVSQKRINTPIGQVNPESQKIINKQEKQQKQNSKKGQNRKYTEEKHKKQPTLLQIKLSQQKKMMEEQQRQNKLLCQRNYKIQFGYKYYQQNGGLKQHQHQQQSQVKNLKLPYNRYENGSQISRRNVKYMLLFLVAIFIWLISTSILSFSGLNTNQAIFRGVQIEENA